MSSFCRYHCASCGAHFSGLAAFDAHRTGPASDRACTFPDDRGLVGSKGICRISEYDEQTGKPSPRVATVYGLPMSADQQKSLDRLTAPRTNARQGPS